MKKLILLAFLGYSLLGNAQIIDIPNFNFKNALINTKCASLKGSDVLDFNSDVDSNDDGEISLEESQNVIGLQLRNQSITDIVGIEHFTQLQNIYLRDNQLSHFNYSLPQLNYFSVQDNNLSELDLTIYPNLTGVNFDSNDISSIDFSNCPNIKVISCQTNKLTGLNLAGLHQLRELYCSINEITNLIIPPDLKELIHLHCRSNNIQQLFIPALPKLQAFTCGSNGMTYLSMSPDLPALRYFTCGNNQLADLNLSTYINLEELWCGNNLLSILDLSNLVNLKKVYCDWNQLASIDAQDCTSLENLYCRHNSITNLLIKNGAFETVHLDYNSSTSGGPIYICADEFQVDAIEADFGGSNININSFCSFVPGGTYFPVNGQSFVDLDGNGCDANDPVFPNMKFKIDDGSNATEFIANETGAYALPFAEGAYSITPVLANPSIFSIDPENLSVNFPGPTLPVLQDYCLTPIGQYRDLEVAIIPNSVARPGFTAKYQLVYSNSGNDIGAGSIQFNYADPLMALLYTSEDPSNQGFGSLTFDFSDLLPGEIRKIQLQFKINSPAQTPPVNVGDFLDYEATLTSTLTDDNLSNNIFKLHQSVFGSFDPNDKTCLAGEVVTPDMIGDYVPYLIRFENTGNYAAENVVVTDAIDMNRFDISSLRVTEASHEVYTRIREGNQVEFIFENIQLPFDDANNDGFIAFKIKTWPSLNIGDVLENTADIYFDFNLPITTNTTVTTVNYADLDDDGFNSNEDCDDNNAAINAGQIEVPYNGIDDDCNEATKDDDLDGDGFVLAEDCDDDNAAINTDQIEVPYNGIDDDCNEATKDDDLDGDGFVLAEDCDDDNAAINADQIEVPYNGIDDDCNEATKDDDLDGDGFLLAEDCDDDNAAINANQTEVPYNGIDDDCNEATLDDDLDGDGFVLADDCDDDNAAINANQTEVPYNGIDDDCNEATLDDDLDGDGFVLAEDCDDGNAAINANQTEVPYNGIDDDCNEATLDDDLDGDGFVLADDCDDGNAAINANQIEVPYNGIDDDCNEATLDDDLDGDGFVLAEDCDDDNAAINANQTEVPYNGIDDDCNEATLDDDLDGDGFVLAEDCDDDNAAINANQTEVPYNGIDDDCNEATFDDDLDGDGFVLAEDCDDGNAAINANQTEVPYNGIDDDCNEATLDDDLDGDGFVLAEDCDDDNAAANPDMEEIPGNEIDDDCDGQVDELVNAVDALDVIAIKLFPNPTNGWLRIEGDSPVERVELFDRVGRLVKAIESPSDAIDLSGLASGLYFIKLEVRGQQVLRKVVKF